jgi:predicted secreted protein
MNWGGAVVIFVIVWWAVFFAVLPWGVVGRWESADDGVKGADPGAPTKPDLRRKAFVTTAIAAVISAVIIAVVASGVVDLRD